MYKLKNLIVILLGIALIGCKSEEDKTPSVIEKHDRPISVYANDITRMVKPHSRALVSIDRDVVASDRYASVKLLNVEPLTRNQGCQITNVDDTQFEIETQNPTACSFKYTVSTEQNKTPMIASAYSRVLVQEETAVNSASLGSFTLPPKSIAMDAQSCSTIALEDVIPNGASLQQNVDVIGSGVVNDIDSSMNKLNYCVEEAGYNRLFYNAYDVNTNQYYIGTVLVGVSGEGNQPPEVGSFSYYYDPGNMVRAVPAYEEVTIDVSDFISDPEGDSLQIIDIEVTDASATAFDTENLNNKKISFLAKTPGQYYVNYMVSDHNGGYGVGVIDVRASSPIKDYYYDTGNERSSFTLSAPVVQSISDKYGFNYQNTQTIDGFVSEPLDIALFDAKTANAYCKAKGGRLPEIAEIELITRKEANALANNAGWPQGLSYWTESLSSGELSTYSDTNPNSANKASVASVACLNLNILDFKIRDPKYIVIDTFKDLVVTYTNSVGEKSIYTKGLKWETSDPNVISIDSRTGRAIGENKGKAVVTVTSPDNKYTDSLEIEVIAELHIVGSGYDRWGSNISAISGGINVNAPNAIFRSKSNFGDENAVVRFRADFVFENIGYLGTDSKLEDALTREKPPALVEIGYPVTPNATNINLLRDFLYDGGAVMFYTETADGTRGLMRAIFGDQVQAGTFAWGGAVHQYANIKDPILNGPFGDIRGGYWGQDNLATAYVYNLPANSYISYSNAFDWSASEGATRDEEYKNYSTSLRHKRLKFVWAGDAGFTSFDSLFPESSIENKRRFGLNVRNYKKDFDDPDADWHPATKIFGRQAQYEISNSIFLANSVGWLFGSVQVQD
ncbi:invasin [Vibrio alginolyticus]|uniref:invasin n=1 Tax=Vibrio alginolyticus TaxID=663 RepID=UPI001BD53B20|nr:invasin [Vibrio alginolyticus]MBS9848132.1 invasin [Vibrio alginolyticus]